MNQEPAPFHDSPDGDALILGPDLDLQPDLAARVKGELEPGERLIWADEAMRPGVRRTYWQQTYRQRDRAAEVIWWTAALLVLFSVILGIASGDSRRSFGAAFAVLGACWALWWFGVGTLVFRRRNQRIRESRILYALTEQRVITWIPKGDAVQVVSLPSNCLSRVHRIEYGDGSGDVVFEGVYDASGLGGIRGVRQVRRVEALAREILVNPKLAQGGPHREDY